MSNHVYHCERLNTTKRGQREAETTKRGQREAETTKRGQREAETTEARPLRTSGPYLNTTIKGRKIA